MKIILQSNDNEEFEVDRDVIRLSTTLNTMFQDLGMDDPDSEDVMNDPIPLGNVSGAVLRKIIQWCQHHKDDSGEEAKLTDDISSWDKKFLDLDQVMLYELIMAASYLDVRGLLDVACKSVAKMLEGKKPEEVRQILEVKNDLTPEEEEKIRKENAWAQFE